MENLLDVHHLSLQRDGRGVLSDVSFAMRRGEFLCVLGPIGAGKTSLLRCINGIVSGCSGDVALNGKSLESYQANELAALAAYVPQGFEAVFPHQVLEFVQMGRFAHLRGLGWFQKRDHEIVAECLRLCRVLELKDRLLPSLSGGERQRVLLAAALAQEPELLILDEPTTFLDPRHRDEVLEVLNEIRSARHLAILAATHEINLAASCADSVLAIKNGRVVFSGAPVQFMDEQVLKDLYDRKFLFVSHPHSGQQMVLQDY